MVVDATVPSLVLLAVLVAAIAVARVGGVALTHVRQAVRGSARPAVLVTERWCPRVVLIDDDRRTATA